MGMAGRQRPRTEMTSEPAYIFHEYLPWIVVAISLAVAAGAVTFSAYRLRRRAVRPDAAPIRTGEPTALLPESGKNGQTAPDPFVQWSPDTLRQILASELPDSEVIVVSNR